MTLIQVPVDFTLTALCVIIAALLLTAIPLALGWLAIRSRPLRHDILFRSVVLVALLPLVAVLVNRLEGVADWSPRVMLSDRIGQPVDIDATQNVAAALVAEHMDTDERATSAVATPPAIPLPLFPATDSALPVHNSSPGNGSHSAVAVIESNVARDPGTSLPPIPLSAPVDHIAQRSPSIAPASLLFNETIMSRLLPVGGPLILLWSTGSLLMLLAWLRSSARVRTLRQQLQPLEDNRWRSMLADACRTLQLRRLPTLCVSDAIRSPLTIGLQRPMIVIPDWMIAEPHERSRAALAHEVAHVVRRDLWGALLERIALILYWWNPLQWRINRRLSQLREHLCDAHVIARLPDRAGYARMLLDVASMATPASTLPALGLFTRRRGELSERIESLLDEDRPMPVSLPRSLRWSLPTAVGLTIAGLVFFFPRFGMESEFRRTLVAQAEAAENVSFDSNLAAAATIPQAFVTLTQSADVIAEAADSAAGEEPAADRFDPLLTTEAPPNLSPFPNFEAASQPTPVRLSLPAFPANPSPAFGNATDPNLAPLRSGDPASPVREEINPFASNQPSQTEPVAQWGLVLLTLVANDDGSLRELYYFTAPLGSDAAAFDKLAQRLEDCALEYKAYKAASEPPLVVEISADPRLQYSHVIEVIDICAKHVRAVTFAMPPTSDVIEITIGFVRDATGQKLEETPVILCQKQIVPVGELWKHLHQLLISRLSNGSPAASSPRPIKSTSGQLLDIEPAAEAATILLRVDAEVDAKVVQQVIRQAQNVGFLRFTLRTVEPAAAGPAKHAE